MSTKVRFSSPIIALSPAAKLDSTMDNDYPSTINYPGNLILSQDDQMILTSILKKDIIEKKNFDDSSDTCTGMSVHDEEDLEFAYRLGSRVHPEMNKPKFIQTLSIYISHSRRNLPATGIIDTGTVTGTSKELPVAWEELFSQHISSQKPRQSIYQRVFHYFRSLSETVFICGHVNDVVIVPVVNNNVKTGNTETGTMNNATLTSYSP